VKTEVRGHSVVCDQRQSLQRPEKGETLTLGGKFSRAWPLRGLPEELGFCVETHREFKAIQLHEGRN
jgi:hypothetical protein